MADGSPVASTLPPSIARAPAACARAARSTRCRVAADPRPALPSRVRPRSSEVVQISPTSPPQLARDLSAASGRQALPPSLTIYQYAPNSPRLQKNPCVRSDLLGLRRTGADPSTTIEPDQAEALRVWARWLAGARVPPASPLRRRASLARQPCRPGQPTGQYPPPSTEQPNGDFGGFGRLDSTMDSKHTYPPCYQCAVWECDILALATPGDTLSTKGGTNRTAGRTGSTLCDYALMHRVCHGTSRLRHATTTRPHPSPLPPLPPLPRPTLTTVACMPW